MPIIREKLSTRFSPSKTEFYDPQLGVALGAAVMAGILEGQAAGPTLLDVVDQAIKHEIWQPNAIEIFRGYKSGNPIEFKTIIPVGSPLPYDSYGTYDCDYHEGDGPPCFFKLFEGNKPKQKDNHCIGTLKLRNSDDTTVPQITFQFRVDVNGLFRVIPYKCSRPGAFTIELTTPDLESVFDGQSNLKFVKLPKSKIYKQENLPAGRGDQTPFSGVDPEAKVLKKAERIKGPHGLVIQDERLMVDLIIDDFDQGQDLVENFHVHRAKAFLRRLSDPLAAQKLREALEAYQSALTTPYTEDKMVDELETALNDLMN
jgi:molecular chaperone DnaK (HSP70)